MLKAELAIASPLEDLSNQVQEVLVSHILLEALARGDHLVEEEDGLEERRHHDLSEGHHLLQGEVLLLSQLSCPTQEQA